MVVCAIVRAVVGAIVCAEVIVMVLQIIVLRDTMVSAFVVLFPCYAVL